MSAYRNTANLAANDVTTYVVALNHRLNSTVTLTNDPNNNAAVTCRLDASFDNQNSWKTSISLSDPTAAIGAAFLASLAQGQVGTTQDRVFGATHVRVVRTDGAGAVAAIFALGITTN